MKNEVHLKSAHHAGRHSHYFSQKLSNGPTQMPRWKANVCFHSHPSKTIFTNVIQPISQSWTAFNQFIKVVWLRRISPMKILFERKHCFHSSLKNIGSDFETSRGLWFFSCFSDIHACLQINTASYKVGDWRLLPLFTGVKMSQLNYKSNLTPRSYFFLLFSPQLKGFV